MIRMWLLAAAALPLMSTGTAADQERLSWRDVVTAVDRDPRFAAARAATGAVRAGVDVAAAVPNPELEASLGRGMARQEDVARNEWDVSLNVPLSWLARRGPQLAAARAEATAADADAEALRRDIVLELRRLYLDAAYEQELAVSLATTEDQVATLAHLVRRRVESGEARPVEVPRIDIELERARGERAQAEARRDDAAAQLATWLGRTVRRVEPPRPTPAPEERSVRDLAQPRVRAADARVAAARAEVDAARRERVPAVSVGAFYASELDRRAAGVTLSTELPLWNWNGPGIARASARAEAEAARAEATRRELAASLVQLRSACERSAADAERQATRIVPRAEESARTLERSLELGEANLIDVLDARRVLSEARRASLGSARQRDLDCGAALVAAGQEIP